MRRLLPVWSSLFAVLLLSQWAGAGAACLSHPLWHSAGHSAPICSTAADEHPSPANQDQAAAPGCPLCAPLPPAILAAPGPLARAPAILVAVPLATTLAWTRPPLARPTPPQARAPPVRT